MSDGWIRVHRKIRDCWIWENPLYLKAWIDILFSANFKDKKVPFDGQIITIKRGQFITSQRKLGKQWDCSVKTVRKILLMLESDEMVHVEVDNKKTVLTVVNYDFYQLAETDTDTKRETQGTTQGYTQGITQSTTQGSHNEELINNSNKKLKNEKELLSPDGDIGKMDPVQEVIRLYNEICVSFPRTRSLSESRRKAIKARLKVYTIDDFREVFEKAEASNFLKGQNNNNWSPAFDWLVKDENFVKVLEGNYDNDKNFSKKKPTQKTAEEYLREKAAEWGLSQEEGYEFTGNTEIVDSH